MKGTCPACGFGGGLEGFLADAEWREAVLAAAELPSDCGALAIRYVGLFRPEKRALSPSRAARLIREVCDMLIEGVDFDRQRIKAPSHVWRQALIQMLDAPNIQRPLRNHHYLLRIVQGLLAKQADMTQADRAMRRRSAARMDTGPAPIGQALERVAEPALPELPPDERETRMAKARETLLSEGFTEKWLVEPLVEQKAREMYAEEVKHGSDRS